MEKHQNTDESAQAWASIALFKRLVALLGVDEKRAKIYDNLKIMDANELIAAENAKIAKAG